MIARIALRGVLFAAIAFAVMVFMATRDAAVSTPLLLDAALYAVGGALVYSLLRYIIAWINE